MSFLYKIFDKKEQPNKTDKTQSQKKPSHNKKMENKLQKQNQFSFKKISPTKYSVHLNQKYQIQEGDPYYELIQVLVDMIKEKNNNNKYHIKQRFGMNYFSSLQFVLGKCNMEEEKCAICMMEFQISKDIEKQLAHQTDQDVYMLPCSHKFHIQCLMNLIGDKKWAKCPICSTIFGKMTGDQPEGKMTVTYNNHTKLPGYEKYGTIQINYQMNGGNRNGTYFAGTSRVAYLPDNKQGMQVLQLLQEAFDRKLIFTVGRSVTTGLDNQTVWNGIHHKTSTHGGAASFGYPDPTYLQRVKQQLAAKGITLESLKDNK